MAEPEVKDISTHAQSASQRAVEQAVEREQVEHQRTIRGPQGETVRVVKGNAPVRHRGGVSY